MESIQIDILNPKAKKLLQDLADMDLIRIKRSRKSDFTALLTKIRSKPTESLNLEDITKEVEDVRKSRYEK